MPPQPKPDPEVAAKVAAYNDAVAAAAAALPFHMPIAQVRWVPVDDVRANDYNPNAVASHEMRLLTISIEQDGYTQPVVAVEDPDGGYVIVDGFHRWTVMKTQDAIREKTAGYLPIVVIDKTLAERMAATVRHNRARGKHSVAGMSNLVFGMLMEGTSDAEVCDKLGLEAEELARLKYVTGFAKLYEDGDFSAAYLTDRQLRQKAAYKAEHPDEHLPPEF